MMDLLLRTDPEVVMPLNSTPLLSQAMILTLLHRLAAAIDEDPSDETLQTLLWWLRRAASVLDVTDPLLSPYVGRLLPSVQQKLDSTRRRLAVLPSGPQMIDAARAVADVQKILSGRHFYPDTVPTHNNSSHPPWLKYNIVVPRTRRNSRPAAPPPVQSHTPPTPTEDWDKSYSTVLDAQDSDSSNYGT